jgi:hypothetical protein
MVLETFSKIFVSGTAQPKSAAILMLSSATPAVNRLQRRPNLRAALGNSAR